MNEETVTITKLEYEKLKDRDLFLTALEHAGVDNWDWYGEAQDIYKDFKKAECRDI